MFVKTLSLVVVLTQATLQVKRQDPMTTAGVIGAIIALALVIAVVVLIVFFVYKKNLQVECTQDHKVFTTKWQFGIIIIETESLYHYIRNIVTCCNVQRLTKCRLLGLQTTCTAILH